MKRIALIAGTALVLAAPALAQSFPQRTTVTQTTTPTSTMTTTTTTTVVDTDVVDHAVRINRHSSLVYHGPRGDTPMIDRTMDTVVVAPKRSTGTIVVTRH